MSKYEVVMIRHGESEWNQKNLFCGWFDSDLSDAGRAEAEAAERRAAGGAWAFGGWGGVLAHVRVSIGEDEVVQRDVASGG